MQQNLERTVALATQVALIFTVAPCYSNSPCFVYESLIVIQGRDSARVFQDDFLKTYVIL